MPTPGHPVVPLIAAGGTRLRGTPVALWDAVVRARVVLAHQRQLPQSWSVSLARTDLLSALEAYVESLDERGRPIPYAIRDELRLQRLTCRPRS